MKKGMRLRLVGATGAIRDILKAGGYEDILSTIKPGVTVTKVIDEWMQYQEELEAERRRQEESRA
jgi:hypothetical protein